jgi:hypothetical protein
LSFGRIQLTPDAGFWLIAIVLMHGLWINRGNGPAGRADIPGVRPPAVVAVGQPALRGRHAARFFHRMTAALGGAAEGVNGMKETSNIKHPTTNIQCGRAGASLDVRCSMLVVGYFPAWEFASRLDGGETAAQAWPMKQDRLQIAPGIIW